MNQQTNDTLQTVQVSGYAFAFLVDRLDVPQYVKEVFLMLAEKLEGEELNELYELTKQAVLEQMMVEMDEGYSKESETIDAHTATELEVTVGGSSNSANT